MSEQQTLANAVAHHALASFCKRSAKKSRDVLLDGSNHKVDLVARGIVNDERVNITVRGALSVGLENPRGYTQQPDLKVVLAYALELMPKTKRKTFFERLAQSGDSAKKPKDLPDVSPETEASVSALIADLQTKSPVRGSVKLIVEV